MKTCPKCRTSKSTDDFHRHAGTKDGLQSRCKECQKADTYAWRARNPEAVKAVQAKSYARRGRHTQRHRLYGLSREDYESAVSAQSGVCAICHLPPDREVLDVDHDHTTGMFRGLLCRACNTALGKFKDSQVLLALAIAYLDRAEAARPD